MDIPSRPGEVFCIWAKPNAKKTQLIGYNEQREAFEMRVAAVAEKGRANDEILSYLKKEYGLACEIINGHGARKKRLRVL